MNVQGTGFANLGPSPFSVPPDLATMRFVAEFNCGHAVLLRRWLRRLGFRTVALPALPTPVPAAAYERLDSGVPEPVTAGRDGGQIRRRSVSAVWQSGNAGVRHRLFEPAVDS